jgi:hypothetical protein
MFVLYLINSEPLYSMYPSKILERPVPYRLERLHPHVHSRLVHLEIGQTFFLPGWNSPDAIQMLHPVARSLGYRITTESEYDYPVPGPKGGVVAGIRVRRHPPTPLDLERARRAALLKELK